MRAVTVVIYSNNGIDWDSEKNSNFITPHKMCIKRLQNLIGIFDVDYYLIINLL